MVKIQNCTVVFKLFGGGDDDSSSQFTHEQFVGMAQNGWDTEYRPQRFHAIIMRLRYSLEQQQQQQQQTRYTIAALIFRSGRVVLTGVRQPEQASRVARRVVRKLQQSLRIGGDDQRTVLAVHSLRLVNLVGSHTMPNRLAIERFVREHQQLHGSGFHHMRYDPTIFPAVRCKFSVSPQMDASCLIYISGKLIVTGVRTQDQLETTFHTLISTLSHFIRQ